MSELRIVVLSDFQRGSQTEALQSFEWPQRVRVAIRLLEPKQTTNAHGQLLRSDPSAPDEEAQPRVRIANAGNSTGDQFFLAWASETRNPRESEETAVYVPPGQNRVVKLPRPENNVTADRIVLRGDDHEFDNTFYVTPPRKQEVEIVYAGDDAPDDPEGLQYYLRLAATGDPLRSVRFRPLEADAFPGEGWDSAALKRLVVVTRSLSRDLGESLRKFVADGGQLLLVPHDRRAAAALPTFFDDVELVEPSAPRSEDDFTLLGEIDYTHPLFLTFASPRYSDFTKIHFWSYRPVKLRVKPTTRVVARFDDGRPWLLERTLGKGRVLALTSGWHPGDSQLALSTKFVPLVGNLLDLACGATQPPEGVVIGEAFGLPGETGGSRDVRLPDGRLEKIAASATSFEQTEQPGIYEVVATAAASSDDLRFAVNLASSESDTAPLDFEQLEQWGVKLGDEGTAAERLDRERQQRDTELESRQKLWRWLLVACLGLLILETWLAGRASRPASQATEAAT